MNIYIGSNSFTEYYPSQVLSKLIPEKYLSHIDLNYKIDSLMKYDGFLNNIIQMRKPESEPVIAFKKWCDGVRDYEMLGLLSFLQSFSEHSDSWLTILDLDYFFSTPKPSILVTDYKPLADKYFMVENLLVKSEKLLQFIASEYPELDFLRLSVEPVKIMHQHLLLLLRVVLFDFPIASDSLQTLLRIKNAKGILNDNEQTMVEVGQTYSSLSPIILNFYVSPSVHEMWQAIMKTLKDELDNNEYRELEQLSKTQPAWLEKPKASF